MAVTLSEWQRYGRALSRVWLRLLVGSLAVAIVAAAAARWIGPTYEVYFSYLIALQERDQVPDFRFDGYYALQATDLFASTLAQWIVTPEVLVEAHREARLEIGAADPRQLVQSVRARKTAPQLVEVVVTAKEKESAEQLAQGLTAAVARNVDRYHDEGIPQVRFRVVKTDSWTGVRRPAVGVVGGATFFLVFFLGLNGVLLKESFRRW